MHIGLLTTLTNGCDFLSISPPVLDAPSSSGPTGPVVSNSVQSYQTGMEVTCFCLFFFSPEVSQDITNQSTCQHAKRGDASGGGDTPGRTAPADRACAQGRPLDARGPRLGGKAGRRGFFLRLEGGVRSPTPRPDPVTLPPGGPLKKKILARRGGLWGGAAGRGLLRVAQEAVQRVLPHAEGVHLLLGGEGRGAGRGAAARRAVDAGEGVSTAPEGAHGDA